MRPLAGILSAMVGTAGVFGLLLAMNGLDRSPRKPPAKAATAIEVAAPPPQPRKPRPRPKPRKAQPRKAAAPIPTLAAGVGGLDLGLFGNGGLDLSGATQELLGDSELAAMTADAVDVLPVATYRAPAPYPARARAKGETGFVRLALDVDARGRLTGSRIVEARPPGVFDDAALQTVRKWKFDPASYQGQPVAVSGVELRIDFDLEQR